MESLQYKLIKNYNDKQLTTIPKLSIHLQNSPLRIKGWGLDD